MEPLGGWQFEDSLFAPSRERDPGGGAALPSGAKRCEPCWFCGEADGGEGDGGLTASKFRADWAYRRREFEKALCEYSNCLLLLPASNIAMRRDVQEGQARCLSRLGRHKEALDIAEKMRNGATNTDHLMTVLSLQFVIYQGLENVEKKITCLQQLICLHPFNPWYWKLLAEAYMGLLQSFSPLVIPETNVNQSEEVSVSDSGFKTPTGREINLQLHSSDSQKEGPRSSLATETKGQNAVTCSSSQAVKELLCASEESERTDEGKHAVSESWEQNVSKKVGIKACASFIRARLLLQLTQLQQSSFVLENNRKGQKEIDDKVAQLGFRENSLLLMTKVMGQDIIPEKLKEEFQGEVKCIGPSALSSLVTASATEFENKWFSNLQDHLCHFDRQFCSDIYLPPSVT
uniref:Zinc fingers and homeoboxes protein 1 n=1 Tax=Falco tinnunculus TaxID=100819 RepID=A0A8C4UJB4_FALTI